MDGLTRCGWRHMRHTRNLRREKQNFHTNKVHSEHFWRPDVTLITGGRTGT